MAKPETLRVRYFILLGLCLWVKMRDSCDPGGVSDGSRLAVDRPNSHKLRSRMATTPETLRVRYFICYAFGCR